MNFITARDLRSSIGSHPPLHFKALSARASISRIIFSMVGL